MASNVASTVFAACTLERPAFLATVSIRSDLFIGIPLFLNVVFSTALPCFYKQRTAVPDASAPLKPRESNDRNESVIRLFQEWLNAESHRRPCFPQLL